MQKHIVKMGNSPLTLKALTDYLPALRRLASVPVMDRGHPGWSLLGDILCSPLTGAPEDREGCSQGVSLSVCPSGAWPPGRRGPYGFVLRQPVRNAQAADLCRDLLPMAWLGDPNGCEVLSRGEAL